MLTLNAENRNLFGKQLKKDRALGKLPVVIYGPKDEPGSFFVDKKEFDKLYKEIGESTVIDFKTPDGSKDVLIYSVDYDPVSSETIHADFYVIEKGKKVEVDVELEFIGEAPAVKSLNGVLVKVMHELPIEAMPKDLPHNIPVDMSVLVDFSSQITVADLKIPAGVTVLAEADEVIALISQPQEEEVESTETLDLENIEVEKKGKKETEAETDES